MAHGGSKGERVPARVRRANWCLDVGVSGRSDEAPTLELRRHGTRLRAGLDGGAQLCWAWRWTCLGRDSSRATQESTQCCRQWTRNGRQSILSGPALLTSPRVGSPSCPWFVFLGWSWRVLVCFHGSNMERPPGTSHDNIADNIANNIERLLRALPAPGARWCHRLLPRLPH
jgi:hypothetical protein